MTHWQPEAGQPYELVSLADGTEVKIPTSSERGEMNAKLLHQHFRQEREDREALTPMTEATIRALMRGRHDDESIRALGLVDRALEALR